MAFQHPQQRRARAAAHQQHAEYQEDHSGTELSTSVDSEVLLFGGAQRRQQPSAASSLQLVDGPAVDQSTWSLVPPQHQSAAHQRTHSPASTYRSSASSSATSSLASPATGLAHSLFPSHDGGGIFVQGAESLVASDTGLGGAYSSGLDDERDSSIPSGASALSDDSSLSGRRTARRSKNRAPSQHLGGSMGGSWALTEEALSTVPHATPLGGGTVTRAPRSQGSAEFTSDSSEDESVEGMVGVVIGGRKRTPVRRRGELGDQEAQEEEDGLSTTPHAISAGFRARDVYPSPPPEDRPRLQTTRIKRRHRQPGRAGGSQKRSSTSGSVAGSEVLAIPSRPAPRARSKPSVPASSQEQVFLGPLVSRLLAVESSTLDLLSSTPTESTKAPLATPEATPTPSRAASPTRLTTPRPRGLAALGEHARDELGDERMFHLSEESESEGEATETEMDHHTWVASSPVFAPRPSSTSAPARSFSATSLPLYLPLISSNLSSATSKPPTRMRRTGSFSSSSGSPREENAWGGEFEGFEAAMSYWRRLLRVMRGFGGEV